MRRITFWAVILALLIVPVESFGQCQPGQCQNGQCPSQQAQPWLPQPIGRPIQQAVPVSPTASLSRPGHETVVRIEVDEGRVKGYGSGVIVDTRNKSALVLTAGHLFSDPHRAITVYVKGRGYKARLLRRDATQDLAALEIADPGVGRLWVRRKAFTVGLPAYIYGYGRGSYRVSGGKYVKVVSGDNGKTWQWGDFSFVARDGDSGGPILDQKGYLVGIVSGTDGRITCGPCLPRVRAFLRCILPPWPNRPGVIFPKPIVVMPVRPAAPTPTLPPTLPTLEPSPIAQPTIDYEKLAALIYAKVEANADKFCGEVGRQGPRGQGGPQGEVGPQGKTGEAGPTPAIKIADLAEAVVAKLPPVRVEWERLDGTIITQEKPLGEPLRFKSEEIDVSKKQGERKGFQFLFP